MDDSQYKGIIFKLFVIYLKRGKVILYKIKKKSIISKLGIFRVMLFKKSCHTCLFGVI